MSLVSFLLGRNADSQQRKLRAAQKRMNKAGYKFYKLGKERLLPASAAFLYDVYVAIDPLREFFLDNTSDIYYAYAVIDRYKGEKITELSESLSEESLEAQGEELDFDPLEEETHKRLKRLVSLFDSELTAKINSMYNSVILLKRFCLIDYYALLRRFKSDLREHHVKSRVSFGPLPKKMAMDILPDFISAAVNLLTVEYLPEVLSFVSELSPDLGFERKRFDSMMRKLMEMNQLEVFDNFGRLLFHDAEYEAKPSLSPENVVKPYLDSFSASVEGTLRSIGSKKRSQRFSLQMKKVFNGTEILELENYTAKASEILEDINADLGEEKKLAYTEHARAAYFHTFVKTYLGKQLLDFVEKFAIHAEIYGGDYTSKFSAEYRQMLSADDEIVQLDMELGQGFPTGYKIAMLVDAARQSDGAAKKLYTECNHVNKLFAAQLNAAMDILHDCLKKFSVLLEDRQSMSPSLVKNWDVLDKLLQEPVLPALTDITVRLGGFVDLMDG